MTSNPGKVAEKTGTYAVNTASPQSRLKNGILNELHQHVASMEPENFLVRPHLKQVTEFSQRDRWDRLTPTDAKAIASSLANLPNTLPLGERLSKEFDLLCLKLQLSVLKKGADFIALRDRVRDLLSQLESKREIPAVKNRLEFIEEVQNESWWQNITAWEIEDLRLKLRDAVQFIDKEAQAIVYTNFSDSLEYVQDVNVPNYQTGFSPYQYRKKVEAYIRQHQDNIAIAKLKRNEPLTDADLTSLENMLFSAPEIEGKERFQQVYGAVISLKLFIRQLVGLDRNAAKLAFEQYLEGNNFSANQIRFVENIIDYLTQNGTMDPGQLYEAPFTQIHPKGLDGVFADRDAEKILNIVRSLNATVDAKFNVAYALPDYPHYTNLFKEHLVENFR